MDAEKVYDKFVKSRNLALEKLLNKYRSLVSEQITTALRHIYLSYKMSDNPSRDTLNHIIFQAAHNIEALIRHLRRNVRILTVTSEYEILARIGKSVHTGPIHVPHGTPEERHLKAGGPISARVAHYFNNMIRKIESVAELARIKGERLSPEEVRSLFPKPRRVAKRKVIRRLKEAEKDDEPFSVTTDFVSDAEWQGILEDYMQDYVPEDRSGTAGIFSDEEMTDAGLFPSGTENAAGISVTYDWEIERDLTHDFVEQVRSGQIEAATAAGVDDYVWIAIIDDVTDQCCRWRDGLTTQEIEDQLNTKHRDDQCEGAVTPPAHFNCRCDIAPKLQNMPDVPASTQGDFEEWLKS